MANRFLFDGMSFKYESKTDLEKNAEGSAFILDGKERRLEDLIIEKKEIKLGEVAYSTPNGLPAYIFYESVPAFDEFDYIYDTSRCLSLSVTVTLLQYIFQRVISMEQSADTKIYILRTLRPKKK